MKSSYALRRKICITVGIGVLFLSVFTLPVSLESRHLYAYDGPGVDGAGTSGTGDSGGGSSAADGVGPGDSVDEDGVDISDPTGVTGDPSDPSDESGNISAPATSAQAEDAEEDSVVASFFSAVIDAFVGIIGNAISIAVTGQTIGQNITGASSPVSDVAHGMFGAVSGSGQGSSGTTAGGNTASNSSNSGEVGGGEGGPFFPVASLAPSIQFSSDKLVVNRGDSVKLMWDTSHTERCTALDSWVGEKELRGEENLLDVQNSGVYTLSCTGASQSFRSRTVFITVLDEGVDVLPSFADRPDLEELINEELVKVKDGDKLPAPIVALEAQPPIVSYNSTLKLLWNAQNAIVCVGGDDWPRSQATSASGKNYVPTSGTRTIRFVTQSSQFTLACFAADGQVTRKSINVTVNAHTPATTAPNFDQ